MTYDNELITGVPLLVTRPETGSARGTVLWYHGFGVDKETHRPELERIARAGFIAIGVDVVGHGDRRAEDLGERMAGTQADALHSVVRFAAATAAELPDLLTGLGDRGLATRERVAVAGISMGAFVVYRAVVDAPRLAAAVAILGSPRWPDPASPHAELPALAAVPLLSITAESDANVPPGDARELHARLTREHPEARHRYVELAGAEHLMSAESWEVAMESTISWLQEFLPPL